MLSGTGMYVWKIKNTEDGAAPVAARLAKESGLTHVLVKVLDGEWTYNLRPYYVNGVQKWADDILGPFVDAFHAQGIQVWGWGWLHLDNPLAEVAAAKKRVGDFRLDGWVMDAEGDAKGKYSAATTYAAAIRDIGVPVALSSYRYPSYHPTLPWKQLLSACNLNMPQVYWLQATNAGEQLTRSVNEFRALYEKERLPDIPIVPTGAAFTEWGWTAQPGEVREFLETAAALKLPAANFWVWDHARNLGLWETIAEFARSQDPQDPPPGDTVPLPEWVTKYAYPWMLAQGYFGPAPASQ